MNSSYVRFWPKADMCGALGDVCFVPQADIAPFTRSPRRRARAALAELSRPSALAVLRLITSSNFVGCSTGRSAGLAPFRILSTYAALRR